MMFYSSKFLEYMAFFILLSHIFIAKVLNEWIVKKSKEAMTLDKM